MLRIQSKIGLQNSGLRINQGCNLKWKLGDKQEHLFFSPASLQYYATIDDGEQS